MKSPKQQVDSGETMAEMWAGFAGMVIPDVHPHSIQYSEMRKAFYSGALCLFNWFMVQLEPGDEPTETDLERVSKMSDEIHAFLTAEAGGRRQ